MKAKGFFLAIVTVMCAMTMTMTSCTSDNDDNPVTPLEPESLADVTVLFYGHGGGNLDQYLIGNLRQFYQALPSCYENVKVAVEYKFSNEENFPLWNNEDAKNILSNYLNQMGEDTAEAELNNKYYIHWMNPEGNSTFRFVLDPAQTLRCQAAGNYLPGNNSDFTNPDSLTNFINWAARQCPAHKYVLVLSDHGGGYFPADEIDNNDAAQARMTRGVIYDNGHDGQHFTAKSLARAIKAADIHLDAVYYDACLMNCLEYQFELKDVTDYIVASTYIVQGSGGIFDTLVECLSGASENLDYAFGKYVEYAARNWDKNYNGSSPFYSDITTTSTANLNRLGELLREFTDRLCDTYQHGTDLQRQQIDNVTRNAVKIVSSYPYYDISKYTTAIMNALPEVYDKEFSNELKESFISCAIGQYTSQYLLDHGYKVDYSVLLGANGSCAYTSWNFDYSKDWTTIIRRTLTHMYYYQADGTVSMYKVIDGDFTAEGESDYSLDIIGNGSWGGTLESVYEQTAFDRMVGWSRWLRLNQQEPSLWCPNEFGYSLPDGDVSDDPFI